MMDVNTRLGAAVSGAQRWLEELAADGPDLRVNAEKKAVHEAQELVDSTTLEELADVTICLAGVASAKGWSLEDWARAVESKTAVNAGRTWSQKEDGTWQHD